MSAQGCAGQSRARWGVRFLLAALAGCALAAAPAVAAAASPQMIRVGATPALPQGARVVGAVPASKQLQLTIALESQDPGGLESLADPVSTPSRRSFASTLGVGEFAQRFGATPAQIATRTLAAERRRTERRSTRRQRPLAAGTARAPRRSSTRSPCRSPKSRCPTAAPPTPTHRRRRSPPPPPIRAGRDRAGQPRRSNSRRAFSLGRPSPPPAPSTHCARRRSGRRTAADGWPAALRGRA